ncbi:hypothetical protein GCM10023221_05540 [Luteimicrobium xylanilyticum]|uniref:DUF3093 domain-containing protein n=1 Tax=Luteimicrobium xylanilyticum TaxID=1133546 RepID=A0A5P9QBG1_9MICO|nr:DUF3093 domain-containing protein [Luteimicrobium xylanilyticum]QFU98460.1 hypothetical protein KDY119_01976 [Luteimicrobium xylanilyticum]
MPEPSPQAAVSATFRERLHPGPAWVVGAVCVGFVLGITLWLISVTASLIVGAVAAVVLAVLLWTSSPVVAVGPGPDGAPWLWAGRARIPVALLADPRALDAAGLRTELGPGSDARTYACLRPWLRAAVAVRVVDPEDPTPGWLVGTRRPADLEAALRAAGAAAAVPADRTPADEAVERGTAATPEG